ncbi:MAG: hypothetical protein SAJ12_05905 [Jaaginema sp. PMC 1079.18]|nr:hypothetical protein [Jaaginema sp. PMC 1080.18]MEC4850525.1 hypothetical protein [Jaaginema sp. PMC 1079.18]MEC4865781.1 hypothetical protein [Jaaginema sp. PMC 1078.18]
MIRYFLLAVNLISLVLCTTGYILNIGWYRFLFGIVLVPAIIIHYVIHFSFAFKTLKTKTIWYSCLSNLALIIALALFPDVSDAPGEYAVFGLYKNPPEFFWTIAQASFVTSIVLTVMAITSAKASKREN